MWMGCLHDLFGYDENRNRLKEPQLLLEEEQIEVLLEDEAVGSRDGLIRSMSSNDSEELGDGSAMLSRKKEE